MLTISNNERYFYDPLESSRFDQKARIDIEYNRTGSLLGFNKRVVETSCDSVIKSYKITSYSWLRLE